MSTIQIFKLVYAAVGIVGSYVLVVRLLAGEWVWALMMLGIVALSVYRLLTLEDE
jgi:hypothetical protein